MLFAEQDWELAWGWDLGRDADSPYFEEWVCKSFLVGEEMRTELVYPGIRERYGEELEAVAWGLQG